MRLERHAAAGRLGRGDDVDARPFEHLDGRVADARVHVGDHAAREEEHAQPPGAGLTPRARMRERARGQRRVRAPGRESVREAQAPQIAVGASA